MSLAPEPAASERTDSLQVAIKATLRNDPPDRRLPQVAFDPSFTAGTRGRQGREAAPMAGMTPLEEIRDQLERDRRQLARDLDCVRAQFEQQRDAFQSRRDVIDAQLAELDAYLASRG
jgi:hypothetical protein